MKAQSRREMKRLMARLGPDGKKAWMAGALTGNEIAFELVLRSLENLMKTLGIKRRKRHNKPQA